MCNVDRNDVEQIGLDALAQRLFRRGAFATLAFSSSSRKTPRGEESFLTFFVSEPCIRVRMAHAQPPTRHRFPSFGSCSTSPVQRVALDGLEARFADRLLQRPRRSLPGACLAPPTLVMSYQTTVPSMSSAPFWSMSCAIGERLHDPERLDVREVVEHQPRDRERAQVLQARRAGQVLEFAVVGEERERDDGLEVAGRTGSRRKRDASVRRRERDRRARRRRLVPECPTLALIVTPYSYLMPPHAAPIASRASASSCARAQHVHVHQPIVGAARCGRRGSSRWC